jgi:hypothetical protein
MAAIDTFQWLINDVFQNPNAQEKDLIEGKREYLFSLRSEDERQRYVGELLREFMTDTHPISSRK